MPRRKRDQLKRHAGYVLSRLDTAAEHVAALHEAFKPHHEAHAAFLETLGTTIFLMRGEFERFCLNAWGKTPDVVSRWTSTGQDYRDSGGGSAPNDGEA